MSAARQLIGVLGHVCCGPLVGNTGPASASTDNLGASRLVAHSLIEAGAGHQPSAASWPWIPRD